MILDAGCGEGSHASRIQESARHSFSTPLLAVGIDLSKEPANYAEFRQLLTDDGLVIKVVPGRHYLREIREILYENTDKQAYANETTLAHFSDHFAWTDAETITYRFPLENHLLEPLLGMTPLFWGTTEERLRRAKLRDVPAVTVDLTILYGRNPSARNE